jgi:hypothetical protein
MRSIAALFFSLLSLPLFAAIGGMKGGGIISGAGWRPKRKPEPKNEFTTVTGADGTYTLDGLVPRAEDVHFSHPAHMKTVRTVTLEGREKTLDVQLSAAQP